MRDIGFFVVVIALGIADFLLFSHKASADSTKCYGVFVTKSVERVCDPETGVVCYVLRGNGHGIEMMSCVRP